MLRWNIEEENGLTKICFDLPEGLAAKAPAGHVSGRNAGFLPVGIVVRAEGYRLIYEAGGLVSLAKYMRIFPVDGDMLLGFLGQLARRYAACLKDGMSPACLALSADCVFVNPFTAELSFIYLPVEWGRAPDRALRELAEIMLETLATPEAAQEPGLEPVRRALGAGAEFDIGRLLGAMGAEEAEAAEPDSETADIGEIHPEAVDEPVAMAEDEYDSDDSQPLPLIAKTQGRGLRLTVVCDGFARQEEIDRFPCIIGRSPRLADIVLDDISVSRKHAVIDYVDGSPHIADNHSSNGLYVNGDMIIPGQWLPIMGGDVIRIGRAAIEVMTLVGQ